MMAHKALSTPSETQQHKNLNLALIFDDIIGLVMEPV